MSVCYNTLGIPLNKKVMICNYAKDICKSWHVDILDCRKSVIRQKIEMPFNEIMEKLRNSSHFSIIHRSLPPEDHIEVGFSTMEGIVDYFLWILIDPIVGAKLLSEFNLKPRYTQPHEQRLTTPFNKDSL